MEREAHHGLLTSKEAEYNDDEKDKAKVWDEASAENNSVIQKSQHPAFTYMLEFDTKNNVIIIQWQFQ